MCTFKKRKWAFDFLSEGVGEGIVCEYYIGTSAMQIRGFG